MIELEVENAAMKAQRIQRIQQVSELHGMIGNLQQENMLLSETTRDISSRSHGEGAGHEALQRELAEYEATVNADPDLLERHLRVDLLKQNTALRQLVGCQEEQLMHSNKRTYRLQSELAEAMFTVATLQHQLFVCLDIPLLDASGEAVGLLDENGKCEPDGLGARRGWRGAPLSPVVARSADLALLEQSPHYQKRVIPTEKSGAESKSKIVKQAAPVKQGPIRSSVKSSEKKVGQREESSVFEGFR